MTGIWVSTLTFSSGLENVRHGLNFTVNFQKWDESGQFSFLKEKAFDGLCLSSMVMLEWALPMHLSLIFSVLSTPAHIPVLCNYNNSHFFIKLTTGSIHTVVCFELYLRE